MLLSKSTIMRSNHGKGEEQFMIQSKPHYISRMAEAVLLHKQLCQLEEQESLVFIVDVTADRSSRIKSPVYRVIPSAQTQK